MPIMMPLFRHCFNRKSLRHIAMPVIAFEFWFGLIYLSGFTPMAAWLLKK